MCSSDVSKTDSRIAFESVLRLHSLSNLLVFVGVSVPSVMFDHRGVDLLLSLGQHPLYLFLGQSTLVVGDGDLGRLSGGLVGGVDVCEGQRLSMYVS